MIIINVDILGQLRTSYSSQTIVISTTTQWRAPATIATEERIQYVMKPLARRAIIWYVMKITWG